MDGPTRTCIGCRRKAPKRDLVRIVRSADGEVALDHGGSAPGRGAYVCNVGCLAQALRRGRVGRHLRVAVEAARLESLAEELGRAVRDARRSTEDG